MARETKREKGVVLYYDYRAQLSLLSDSERGRLLMALLDYGETGQEPELDGAALMAFSFIRSQIDRNAAKYAETCRKRSEAGKKGGRPKADEAGNQGEATENKSETENQSEAKKANAFDEKQDEAKKANTNTNTNTKTNTNTNTNISPNGDIEKEPVGSFYKPPNGGSSTAEPSTPAEVVPAPYREIVELYHSICKSYPKLRTISESRKRAISARWREYGHDFEVFRELFTRAEASQFLKGKNQRNWTADFNWLLGSENMAKVLEGKYGEKGKTENSSFDTDEFFELALRRGVSREPAPTAADDESIAAKAVALKRQLAGG